MKRRSKIFLLILAAACTAAGFFLFYTSFDERKVPADVDQVLVVDIHRIRNELIWEYLQTPSRWKISWSGSRRKEISFADLVKLPDYAFVFHRKDQPLEAWYLLLDAKKPDSTIRQLTALGFEAINNGPVYHAEKWGIDCLLAGDLLLLGNGHLKNKDLLQQTAALLFNEKKHIARKDLEKYFDASTHLQWTSAATAWYVSATGTARFNKTDVDAVFTIDTRDSITTDSNPFSVPANALASVSWSQPGAEFVHYLDSGRKASVSRWLNFNIDSLLMAPINHYRFDLQPFQSRIDTAITYEYDDAFNQVEKKTRNQVTEPAFLWLLSGSGVNDVYRYWQANGNIDSSLGFSPSPLVRSQAVLKRGEQISIQSVNFQSSAVAPAGDGLLVGAIRPGLLPDTLYTYLPGGLVTALRECSLIDVKLEKRSARRLELRLHALRRDR
ncbi:MAG TPA: hypothetical protein PLQ65_04150 [Flavihumibacter sp.]|nr:hypothetical protein [Flavihumibacter sp.]